MFSFSPNTKKKPRFVLVIGLVGKLCAGKATFSQQLEKAAITSTLEKKSMLITKGDGIPVEDLVKELLQLRAEKATLEQQKEAMKQSIIKINKQMQSTYEERCKKVLDDWETPQIIDRIYTTYELNFMSKRNYFHKIYIDTPIMQRFENFKKKYAQLAEQVDIEMFCILDDSINYGMMIQESISQIKVTITNDGSIEDLHNQIKKKEKKIFRAYKPTWDQYFMKLAVEVKKRSNCSKRSVGAILVSKDNRILSTGYNGTPYNLRDCFDNGCQRCNSNIGQGKNLMECKCIHAEDNCILDIGVRTVKEIGGTLYTTLFPCKWCAKVMIQSVKYQICQ